MDIYKFINSPAIATHCRNMNHQFSTTDIAYLIWASEKCSIKEKHNAWRNLIATHPDTEIAARPWTPHIKSLRSFLSFFMELENKYLALFFQNEPSCVYSYSIRYPGDEDYTHDPCLFPTFQMCLSAITADIDSYRKKSSTELHYILIEKQWICQSASDFAKSLSVYIDSNGVPWFLDSDSQRISDENRETLDAFKGMWPEIPTPFKRGDLLISQNRHHFCNRPFVLDEILYWEDRIPERTLRFFRTYGDESDLNANTYVLSGSGKPCYNHGPCYLDMDYFNKDSDDSEKFLDTLSKFLKKQLK